MNLSKRYNDAEQVYLRKNNLTEGNEYKQKKLWKRMKEKRGINCLSMKDSRNLIMQVKCLNNIFLTLSELRKRKPELYKSNYCILYEENCPEDFDHIMSCLALQKLQKEVEEAVAKGIRNVQDEKNLSF